MNDVNTLLIATTVLAIGGLGLYIYQNENSKDVNAEYYDDEIDLDDFASDLDDYSSQEEEEEEENLDDIDDNMEEDIKKNKTRRNSHGVNKTKRKHYK